MSGDMSELRKIAEAATPGPWVLDGFAEGGCSEGCCEEYTRLSVYSVTNRGEAVASEVTAQRNADYFDAFDPSAVLALLSRLEQAEQQVARVRDVIKGAPTVDPLRGFAGPPDDWPDDTHFTSYGEWIIANRVREALDGDTRRLADQGLGGGQDG